MEGKRKRKRREKDLKTQTKFSDLPQALHTMVMQMKWRIKTPLDEAVTFREDQHFLRDKSRFEYGTRVISMDFRVIGKQPYYCTNDEKWCISVWSIT